MITDFHEPVRLGGIHLRNRIIRSATHEGMADADGFPTQALQRLYLRLAKGEAGAIITGYAGTQQDGKSCLYNMTMMDTDEKIAPFKDIVDQVHALDTPVLMQIAHCGRQTRSVITGRPTVAPSAIKDQFYSEDTPASLSEKQIQAIIDNFTAAIVRAQKAGFDGVQLHMAHGYLLSQFLSGHANQRRDQWGGTLGNRFRITAEIFRRARSKVGDFPIWAKINAYDGRKGGMRLEEALQVARLLEQSGCRAMEVSCGVFADGLFTIRGDKLPAEAALSYTFKYKKLPGPAKRLAAPLLKWLIKQPRPLLKYNLEAALAIKKAVAIPIMVVGGITSAAAIEEIISSHGLDLVAMSRPFIAEPDIVRRFQEGRQTVSKCIMCNYCAILSEAKPLRCYQGKLPHGDEPRNAE